MRILVCGARDYTNKALVFSFLDHIASIQHIDAVIEGGAKGVDLFAAEWAELRRIEVVEFPANWKGYGRAAGPIRNRQMLQDGYPEMVIAFPKTILSESVGTRNMVEQAVKAKITTIVIEQHSDRVHSYIL